MSCANRIGTARSAPDANRSRTVSRPFLVPMTHKSGSARATALTPASVAIVIGALMSLRSHTRTVPSSAPDASTGRSASWANDNAAILSALPSSGELVSGTPVRSEEHTSELQSQFHLVCRLLLEKKKKHTINIFPFQKKKHKAKGVG